jgi:GSCFA family
MSTHPYRQLPSYCFWRTSIANVPPEQVDPVVSAKFLVDRTDRLVTAGSCFAQYIGRVLHQNGFAYSITESAHPMFSEGIAKDYNYGVFSARYGNIYTARQLVQLIRRAYGDFVPAEDIWIGYEGRYIDPFRPQIQPDGFSSLAEYKADRAQHFAAVRGAFETMDVFIFTLGLTEAWASRVDGAVFPLCPGVAGGEFDTGRHEFLNFDVEEVVADLEAALSLIWQRNRSTRVVLTVSPVPLAATAENRSVLVSTTLSKAVLRVAAEKIARHYAQVAYFPAYEIITGAYTRGAYFGDDLRSITEPGVAHVMRLFLKHYGASSDSVAAEPPVAAEAEPAHAAEMAAIARVVCEEEVLGANAP